MRLIPIAHWHLPGELGDEVHGVLQYWAPVLGLADALGVGRSKLARWLRNVREALNVGELHGCVQIPAAWLVSPLEEI